MSESNGVSSKPSSAVSDLRVAYSNEPLDDSTICDCPIDLFTKWFDQAVSVKEHEPNAMCLSTVDERHRPAARMVLLKAFDTHGFVWYTNYNSRKASHLHETPFASLTFWWPTMQRSVRVEGAVSMVDASESDAYFKSRPAESQLGALVSDQSEAVGERRVLEQRLNSLREEYLDDDGKLIKALDRPSHWGGYRLVPDRIEFWKGRPARLHDRIVFTRPSDHPEGKASWERVRLQP